MGPVWILKAVLTAYADPISPNTPPAKHAPDWKMIALAKSEAVTATTPNATHFCQLI